MSLESAEDINPSVSVRSQSSVYRATRRVHCTKSESTLFAQRIQFAFEIPTAFAPTFETSLGIAMLKLRLLILVRHYWALRLELITSASSTLNREDSQQTPIESPGLLQLVGKDDRGSAFLPADTLHCESFDCHVPLMVLPTNQEISEDRLNLMGFDV